MRLTKRQLLLLKRMCERNIHEHSYAPESGGEMAIALWHTGAFTSLEQGQRTAAQLVKKGLAEELGVTETYAQCYGPTDEGRMVLAELEDR